RTTPDVSPGESSASLLVGSTCALPSGLRNFTPVEREPSSQRTCQPVTAGVPVWFAVFGPGIPGSSLGEGQHNRIDSRGPARKRATGRSPLQLLARLFIRAEDPGYKPWGGSTLRPCSSQIPSPLPCQGRGEGIWGNLGIRWRRR